MDTSEHRLLFRRCTVANLCSLCKHKETAHFSLADQDRLSQHLRRAWSISFHLVVGASKDCALITGWYTVIHGATGKARTHHMDGRQLPALQFGLQFIAVRPGSAEYARGLARVIRLQAIRHTH